MITGTSDPAIDIGQNMKSEIALNTGAIYLSINASTFIVLFAAAKTFCILHISNISIVKIFLIRV
jgi:hypothetical protein